MPLLPGMKSSTPRAHGPDDFAQEIDWLDKHHRFFGQFSGSSRPWRGQVGEDAGNRVVAVDVLNGPSQQIHPFRPIRQARVEIADVGRAPGRIRRTATISIEGVEIDVLQYIKKK